MARSGENLEDAIGNAMVADHGPVATAYLYRSARQLSAIAAVLGRDDDARRYADLAGNVGAAWCTEFLAEDGTTTPDTQATYARALAFSLIPEKVRAASANRLVELIRAARTHISTGFLATPFVLPVLADTGHLDVAYELLLQDSEPSWLVMVDRGATSVWEEWGGVGADATPHASLNHYSKGAVITFLHQHTAGLQLLEPAYRRFRVAPRPGGGITWATACHRSPYGPIKIRWEQHPERFELQLTVPPGTTAAVELPSGRTAAYSAGHHTMSS